MTTKSPKSDQLEAGKKAPAFCLSDTDGKEHCLKDYKGKWVVLYFYPRDNTPGCTREACDFRDAKSRWSRRQAVVLGVSTDSAKSHEKFRTKYNLNFPLLVDEDAALAKKYGVWQKKSMYGKLFYGMVRSTFVIDTDGIIARACYKVKVDGHVNDVLETLSGTT
jgi:peroxiredoxin Q/BCP